MALLRPPLALSQYADFSYLFDPPDGTAHVYTIIATSGGASNLTVPVGGAEFDIFELGGPS